MKNYRLLLAALSVLAGVAFGHTGVQAAGLFDLTGTSGTTETTNESTTEDDEENAREELASPVLTAKTGAKVIGSAGFYVSVGESGKLEIDIT